MIELDFSHNQLFSVPFSHFKQINFSNLEYLNISHNKITYLNANEFSSMKSLKHLIINANRLIELNQDSFVNLLQLNHIELNQNEQLINYKFEHKLFKDPGKTMQHLSLADSNLIDVPKATLRYCFKLKHLYLSNNRIKYLLNYSFGFMFNLLELYLNNNQIENIEQNAFSIDDESMIGPGLIEKLDLSYNRLVKLEANIFSFLTNLRYLLLNNNFIKQIDTTTFYGINYLIILDLSINQLDRLDFLSNQNFSSIRVLKLANNEISRLRPAQFICLKSLKTLDLSSNKIKRITDCAFHGLQQSIKKLILNYNKITKLNSCAFSLNFNSLRFVQIVNNPLKCTSNCEFFFSVYSHPYSIDYTGLECGSDLAYTIKHTSNFSHCSQNQYKRIYESCKDMNKFCIKNMTHFESDCEYKLNDDYLDEDQFDMLDPFRKRVIDSKTCRIKVFVKLNVICLLTFFVLLH